MSKRIAVFPGTFDPITSGHLDIIFRGAALFDELVVGVAENPGKAPALFSVDERVTMIRQLLNAVKNVTVECFDGMTVDFARQRGASAILRGIRTFGDFEYEFQLALANRALAGVETVFVMASAENAFIRSTLIKEAASLGADVSKFVPPEVARCLADRLGPEHRNSAGLRGDESTT